jgi:hypothetical protein
MLLGNHAPGRHPSHESMKLLAVLQTIYIMHGHWDFPLTSRINLPPLFQKTGEKAIDIVIAIVHKYKPAVVYVIFKICSFLTGELNELAAQIAEWRVEEII